MLKLDAVSRRYFCQLKLFLYDIDAVGQPMPAKPPSPPASHAAPRLVEPMKDREAREGEPVQFQCRIVGVPDPVVQWFYNNQIIKPSKYFQLSADPASGCYGLSIAGVFPEDDGSYKCVARNPVGEVACIAQLRVIRECSSITMMTDTMIVAMLSFTRHISLELLNPLTPTVVIWVQL